MLSHVTVQLSQHHFLKRLSFALCVFLSKIQLSTSARVYYWAVYSVLPIQGSVSIPVPDCFDHYRFVTELEIQACVASSFVLLSEDCLSYSGLL